MLKIPKNSRRKLINICASMESGQVKMRGEEAFESCVSSARDVLETSERPTAAREIREAIQALSRKPDPNITGSIQHTMAALECTMRDVLGGSKETLGSMLQKNPGVIPPPLDQAVEKIWGFSSERGRHLHEGNVPSREEAALCGHVSAAVIEYLCRKYPKKVP